jgi:hypothetical protein
MAALDLMFHPLAVIGLSPKQDDGYRGPDELLLDPFFDAASALLRLLEGGRIIKGLRVVSGPNDPRLPDLLDAPDVALIMEAEKYSSGHRR